MYCFPLKKVITKSVLHVLKFYGPVCGFCCEYHTDWGVKWAFKIIVSIYFNKKQKLSNDKARKDSVKSFKTRQRAKNKQ